MSRAHTARRKTIARLKRQHPRNWLAKFHDRCQTEKGKHEGPCTGTLVDLLPTGPYTDAQLKQDIAAAEKAVAEEYNFD